MHGHAVSVDVLQLQDALKCVGSVYASYQPSGLQGDASQYLYTHMKQEVRATSAALDVTLHSVMQWLDC